MLVSKFADDMRIGGRASWDKDIVILQWCINRM